MQGGSVLRVSEWVIAQVDGVAWVREFVDDSRTSMIVTGEVGEAERFSQRDAARIAGRLQPLRWRPQPAPPGPRVFHGNLPSPFV